MKFIMTTLFVLWLLSMYLMIIDEEPEIKDRKRIIRCKDCRRNGTDACAMFCKCDSGILHSWNEADDFCSWGERKSK